MKKLFIIRRIVGGSMLPRLTPGRIVLGLRTRRIKIGDVVILFHDGLEKIKRIDHIEDDGKLYVLGDNAEASTDSREFGFIDPQYVLAKVIWPKT